MIVRAFEDIWSAFSEFNNQALLFASVAVLIYAIVLIVVFSYKSYKGQPHRSIWYLLIKLCIVTLLGVYASYAVSLTLSGREAGSRSEIINLVPFSTFRSANGITVHTIENILLFVPFGFLAPMLWKYNRSFFRMTLLGFITSVMIESTQLVSKRGFFEIDDIILNTFGTMCGYFAFLIIYEGYLADKKRFLIDIYKNEKMVPLGGMYERFSQRHRGFLFILQMIPIVASYFMIMGFSSDTGEESASYSRVLAIKVVNAVPSDIWKKSVGIAASGNDMVNIVDMVEGILRKLAHMCEYGIFAFCVFALIYSIPKIKQAFVYIFTLLCVAILGSVDEMNQSHISGRFGTPRDVVIDMFGATIVLLIVYAICRAAKKSYVKKKPKKSSS